jgi:hypothetical protein
MPLARSVRTITSVSAMSMRGSRTPCEYSTGTSMRSAWRMGEFTM